ncbi:MAG: hypothetical protein ACXVEE_17975 [Polyangiales bacterium]
MRCVLIAGFVLVPAIAHAQQESAAAGVQPEPQGAPQQLEVKGDGERSPSWTQTRSFAATRFWRLDKGEQEVELWWSARLHKDGEDPAINRHLFQIEYMVSLVKGLQLDVYANYEYEVGKGTRIEGAQIEARIAPWDYGKIFANPVLYLEWHPQNRDANRGEARLLLGGEIVPRLRVAMNLLWEQNLDSPTGAKADYIPDREIGGTGALGYEIVPRTLSLGGETRLVWDQQGTETYKTTMKVGPALWLKIVPNHLRLTSTFLFGLDDKTDRFNPLVILGYRP